MESSTVLGQTKAKTVKTMETVLIDTQATWFMFHLFLLFLIFVLLFVDSASQRQNFDQRVYNETELKAPDIDVGPGMDSSIFIINVPPVNHQMIFDRL